MTPSTLLRARRLAPIASAAFFTMLVSACASIRSSPSVSTGCGGAVTVTDIWGVLMRCENATDSTMSTRLNLPKVGFGIRAKPENSSTIRPISATCRVIVSVQRSNQTSGAVHLPVYFQAFFIRDRVQALAPKHPEWKTQEPHASLLKGDMKAVMAGGEKALLQLAMSTHAGLSSEEFSKIVGLEHDRVTSPDLPAPFTDVATHRVES